MCPPKPPAAGEVAHVRGRDGLLALGAAQLTHLYSFYSSLLALRYALHTTKNSFDLRPDDVYACVADAGWITGHTYITYGPLLNGVTTTVFESTPLYPDEGRYWDMVQRHKINVFYTAPTAIRSLMRFGDEAPGKYDLSSLRVLGSVGEPINPAAWQWYKDVIGGGKADVVDT